MNMAESPAPEVTFPVAGRSRQAVAAWIGTGAVVVAFVGMAIVLVARSGTANNPIADIMWNVLAVLYAALGSVIISRQGSNRIGWLLMAIGGALTIGNVSDVIISGIDVAPAWMTVGLFLVLWYNNLAWITWLFPTFLLLYLFPTGEFLSPRWRWALVLEAFMAAALVFLSTFTEVMGPPQDGAWGIENPIGFIGTVASNVILVPWFASLWGLTVGGVASMIVRYRRASDTEKTQIKWVLFAFVAFVATYGIGLLFQAWTSTLPGLVLLIGIGGIPVSITVAVLKFHLYDIDIIISRSLTFGVLAVFIGGVYVGIVVGVGSLFGQADGSSVGLSVVATAVVALVFQPVRGGVERWANRLVYGKRATPYEVLARFSHRSAEESDEDVLVRIPRLIVDGTGVSSAMVWVRSGGGFRTASVWPDSVAVRTLDGDGGFVDPEADVSWPVFHDGELLGGISLVAARGGVITPPERELVTRLADGLGLTLRNSRLTAELRRQVMDLQRSRDRVVSAADEARRSLEHDLDSGPQQLLVAAKVKLGPLRKLAEQAGAVRTAEVLADIEVNAGEAIRAVRDFAAGIYPPLLGAEGLAVALSQETRKAALPVDLEVDGVGRYSREVESAVYFSILEALQNTAKYAEASRAVVRLSARNGDLRFEVSDDGKGFDPATLVHGAGLNGIADRLDTIGGTWTITTTPGTGTTITGTAPTETPGAI